jgi:AraC-like DNA-binding protein
MKEIYVPKAYLEQLLLEARNAGCSVPSILEQVHLSQERISNLSEIPSRQYGEIYRLIMRATQNEWFGMFSSGRVPLGSLRLMGIALLQCDTLQQAIYRAGDFADICRGMNNRFILRREPTVATLTISPTRTISKQEFDEQLNNATPEVLLTSLLTWHRFAEWLIDKEIPLIKLRLKSKKAELKIPLAHANFDNIEFDSSEVSMSFSAAFLDHPILQDQNALVSFIRAAPHHLVTKDPSHTSPADKVRAIINRDVSGSMPSAEQVASQLNVSVTTLRRLLQKEDTSFQKLKDDSRKVAAFHYLECAELSNAEIAGKLGFDEPSAFFRSFKKWTGMTPGEYRTSLK